MKKILSIAFSFTCLTSVAQYVPNNNQGFQFMSVFNPAFSGVEGYSDLKFGYRYQWAGIPGAPQSINLSFNTRLSQPVDLSINSLRTSTASGLVKVDKIPKKKRIIQGFGMNVFNETVGPYKEIGGGISYSFNYPISKKLRLALGVSSIIDNVKVDMNSITLREDSDPLYDYLNSISATQTNLSVRAGIILYSRSFYLGASYLPVFSKSIQAINLAVDQPFYRASMQAGVSFGLSHNFTLKPSILALLQMNNEFLVDYNLKAFVENKVWFGFSYRHIQSGVLMLGFNINQSLGVSYSYEMSLNGLKQYNDGSHELVLSMRLNNFRRLMPYTW